VLSGVKSDTFLVFDFPLHRCIKFAGFVYSHIIIIIIIIIIIAGVPLTGA